MAALQPLYKSVATPPVGRHDIVSVNEEKSRKLPQLKCHPLSSMRVKIELQTHGRARQGRVLAAAVQAGHSQAKVTSHCPPRSSRRSLALHALCPQCRCFLVILLVSAACLRFCRFSACMLLDEQLVRETIKSIMADRACTTKNVLCTGCREVSMASRFYRVVLAVRLIFMTSITFCICLIDTHAVLSESHYFITFSFLWYPL